MGFKATHVVYVSNRRVGRGWRGEKQAGEIIFRTIDHDELPLAVGRDVFYNSDPDDRHLSFSPSNPRSTLRRLRFAPIITIDWKRRRVTLRETALKLTIDFDEVAAVGGRL